MYLTLLSVLSCEDCVLSDGQTGCFSNNFCYYDVRALYNCNYRAESCIIAHKSSSCTYYTHMADSNTCPSLSCLYLQRLKNVRTDGLWCYDLSVQECYNGYATWRNEDQLLMSRCEVQEERCTLSTIIHVFDCTNCTIFDPSDNLESCYLLPNEKCSKHHITWNDNGIIMKYPCEYVSTSCKAVQGRVCGLVE